MFEVAENFAQQVFACLNITIHKRKSSGVTQAVLVVVCQHLSQQAEIELDNIQSGQDNFEIADGCSR